MTVFGNFMPMCAAVAVLLQISKTNAQNYYGGSSSNSNNGQASSPTSACGLNLAGKVQRPYLNLTTQANSGPRKAFSTVDFSPPTEDTFRFQFSANDMTIDLLQGLNAAKTPGGQGAIFSADINNVPALYREGVSIAIVEVAPCAVVVPHVHPRAVELTYVLEGDSLEVGILDSPANSRYIIELLTVGQFTFIPKGLAHYQVNRGCNTVRFSASFGGAQGEDPGIWFIPTSLFDIEPDVTASSFDISQGLVTQLRQGQPPPPFFKGRAECLTRCGLPADNNQSQTGQVSSNSYI